MTVEVEEQVTDRDMLLTIASEEYDPACNCGLCRLVLQVREYLEASIAEPTI